MCARVKADMKTHEETEDTRRIDIGELIDERPLSALQVRVIVLCGLIVLLDGFDIQAMALAVPSLAAEWSLPPSGFGLALTASLVGIGVGAAFVGPLGDRYGRRPLLIASLALVGAGSLATGFSTSQTQLVAWRFVTGLGLGASLPNAVALTSEYVPARRRAALLTLMYCQVAVGALTAGFVAPTIIETSGWQGIFFVGGVLPLALCVALYVTMPESVRLLLAQRPDDSRTAVILAQLAPRIEATRVYAHARERVQRQSVLTLLTPHYRARTVLLWCIYCMNLFALYLLVSWLPTLLRGAGWASAQALKGAVLIQAGGIVGGLCLSWLVDRGRTVSALTGAYCLTAVALGLFMLVPATVTSWSALLLVVGCGTSGTQFGITVLAAAFYPATIRVTGVGWANAIGRTGAIMGPLAGTWVVQQQLGANQVLALLVIPVLMCGICALLVPRVWRRAD
jgi:AAHS family 4-hydroxybenzoate transporter-like MFS transporter